MIADPNYYRGRTYKRVAVREVTDETDAEILDSALEVSRETRSSLFGWRVSRNDSTPSTVVVDLHTD